MSPGLAGVSLLLLLFEGWAGTGTGTGTWAGVGKGAGSGTTFGGKLPCMIDLADIYKLGHSFSVK